MRQQPERQPSPRTRHAPAAGAAAIAAYPPCASSRSGSHRRVPAPRQRISSGFPIIDEAPAPRTPPRANPSLLFVRPVAPGQSCCRRVQRARPGGQARAQKRETRINPRLDAKQRRFRICQLDVPELQSLAAGCEIFWQPPPRQIAARQIMYPRPVPMRQSHGAQG